jgi:hypothetical protein
MIIPHAIKALTLFGPVRLHPGSKGTPHDFGAGETGGVRQPVQLAK